MGPVASRKGAAGSPHASFLDLIDLLFVKRFLEEGISLQRLRKALSEAAGVLGDHHFAQRKFFTDGKTVYLQVKDETDALLELLANGQWVIAPVIKQDAKRIDFRAATGFAERWYPLGRNKPVVIDPAVAYGAPSVFGRGLKTANVYDIYLAENEDLRAVCSWMDISRREAETAVEFECQLKAA